MGRIRGRDSSCFCKLDRDERTPIMGRSSLRSGWIVRSERGRAQSERYFRGYVVWPNILLVVDPGHNCSQGARKSNFASAAEGANIRFAAGRHRVIPSNQRSFAFPVLGDFGNQEERNAGISWHARQPG
jgi:hypothetical protein